MIWFLGFGFIVLMAWSMRQAADQMSRLRVLIPRRPFEKDSRLEFFAGLDLIMSEPGMALAETQAPLLQNLRLRSWRDNVMLVALAPFALWLPYGLATLFLHWSAAFVLGVGAAAILGGRFFGKIRPAAEFVFYTGLFLVAGEGALKMLSMVSPETTDFTMFLADGRMTSTLIWLGAGLISALVFDFEGIGLAIALVGLGAGAMALNAAIALWLGERTGFRLAAFVDRRRWITGAYMLARFGAVTGLLGAAGGLILAMIGTGFLANHGEIGSDEINGRLGLFIGLSLVSDFPLLALRFGVGHFLSRRTVDDLFETLPNPWPVAGPAFGHFLRSGITARLAALDRLQQQNPSGVQTLKRDLNESDWNKIPPAVRAAAQTEKERLSAWFHSFVER